MDGLGLELEFEVEKETKNFFKFNEVEPLDGKQKTTGGFYLAKEELEELGWDGVSNIKITVSLAED